MQFVECNPQRPDNWVRAADGFTVGDQVYFIGESFPELHGKRLLIRTIATYPTHNRIDAVFTNARFAVDGATRHFEKVTA